MWIQSFIDYLRFEKNYSERTIKVYQADLKAFKQFYETLDKELNWSNLDKDIIRQWVVSMMEDGNIASSVNRRLSSLRSFYKFLLQRKMVEYDPAHMVTGPQKEKPLPTYLRESEMNRLLDDVQFEKNYAGARDYMILLMFYSTGIRVSELTNLDVSDVDMTQKQIKVLGKRNKERVIPFGSEMEARLRQYLKERQEMLESRGLSAKALFLHERTCLQMTSWKVGSRVKYYLSMVTTQKKRSPHVLRHTFATSMLNHYADLQSVKELLGHERLSTTEIYTHTSFEELKELYNKAHPRAK
ncbi:MAG: tyrosine-type recombinase/integrase [Bacteroidaceae bacterium]|nr:tyrosine-type recombinase/integrase [Bacteroidaceae bacterium]